MTMQDARKAVVDAGHRLCREKLVSRTWGNISCRVDEETFVITPSGLSYDRLTPDDIVPVAIADLSWQGEIKPSSEKGMHAEVYKLDPQVRMVIHTHQVNASVVASARKGIPRVGDPWRELLGDTIPCAPYGLPGTKKLKRGAARAFRASGSRAVLLAGHGALCYGGTPQEAFSRALALEEACAAFVAEEFQNKTGRSAEGEGDIIAAFLASKGAAL